MVNAAVERALAKERPTPPALATPTRSPTPEVSAQPVVTLSNYSNSVLQEPQQSTLPSADSPVAPEADSEPSVDLHNYNNTVIQQNSSAKRSGRPATMRESILNLLREHSEGLTTEQIRGLLNAQKPIGDTLQGMRRANLVRTEGTGREMRYFLTS